MPITLNMGGVKPAGPLPEGTYTVQIADVEVKETQGKPDNKNLAMKMRVLEGPDGDTYIDRTFNVYQSLHGNSLPFVKSFLEAFTNQEWSEDGMEFEPADLQGLMAKCTLYPDKKGFAQATAWYPAD